MKEGLAENDPIEEQKQLLLGHVRPDAHERIVSLTAKITRGPTDEPIEISMGYAIADDSIKDESLVLETGPVIHIPYVNWQGDRLRESLGPNASVTPVIKAEQWTHGVTRNHVGWRIHLDESGVNT